MSARILKTLLFFATTVCLITALPQTASACPMCKAAAEEEDAQPRAYMTSILFMLAVPGMIFSSLTAGLVVMARKEHAALQDSELAGDIPPEDSDPAE